MRRLLGMLLLCLCAGAPVAVRAQEEGISQRQQERILAKKAKEKKKEQARQDKRNRERHLSIQGKEARKRIKRNLKRVEPGGGTRRGGLFRRKR
ncbi:MAG: hypothetical protein ACK4L7_09845 [Flavobacteriales bacterium]